MVVKRGGGVVLRRGVTVTAIFYHGGSFWIYKFAIIFLNWLVADYPGLKTKENKQNYGYLVNVM